MLVRVLRRFVFPLTQWDIATAPSQTTTTVGVLVLVCDSGVGRVDAERGRQDDQVILLV
jgi:hypothetical protein